MDFLGEEWMIYLLWLALIIIFIVIEAISVEVVAVFLAIGSFFALIVSFFIPELWQVQLAVMIISSALMIIFARKLALKFLKVKNVETNYERLVGREALVTEEIKTYHPGEVKINGVLWTALIGDRKSQEKIEKGAIVEIIKVEGSKLYVNIIANEK